MLDPDQIPYLLTLIDDESEQVQKAVIKELASFGADLEEEIAKLPEPLDENKRRIVNDILQVHNRNWLKKSWPTWLSLPEEKQRIECALGLLAEFQNGRFYPFKLKELLDNLADEYTQIYRDQRDAFKLSNFLFSTKHLRGADEDYYNPYNSNLVYVIQNKKGIPISLALIYILVGYRLGLNNIEGCNFPGHFMARITLGEEKLLVDCFNGGQLINEKDIAALNTISAQVIYNIIQVPTTPPVIIARVLRNLIYAYEQAGSLENSLFIYDLLNDLPGQAQEVSFGVY